MRRIGPWYSLVILPFLSKQTYYIQEWQLWWTPRTALRLISRPRSAQNWAGWQTNTSRICPWWTGKTLNQHCASMDMVTGNIGPCRRECCHIIHGIQEIPREAYGRSTVLEGAAG